MIFKILIPIGILGSVIAMMQFSKYCRLLNQRWTMDPETAERYQTRAQRWLAATGCLISTAFICILLSAILS